MRKIRFKTIFSRMLFLQCMTLISILVVVGIAMTLVVRSQNLREKRELLGEKAESIVESLQNSPSQAEELATTIAKEHDLLVQVYFNDNMNSFFADNRWENPSSLSKLDTHFEDIIADAGEKTQYISGYFTADSGAVMSAYRAFTQNGQNGILLLHLNLSSTYEKSMQLAVWIVIIALVSMVVAVFSSYYVATRIINPFIEINHTVQCYSRGDFSKRIKVVGRDEAAQLGKSFNDMAEQLRNLEATRRSFVANVSHELRSPLTSMKGFLEAMYDGTIPKSEQEKYIALVLSETRRMTVMVNDLLDLARIESGTILLNYETFDINELIRRTLITFEARIVEKRLDLDVRFAQEQCYVYADSTQISQVLRNLIDNAIKYSPDGKMIYISSYALRKEVYVSIKDTGIGIPQEDVPHVFDRFYKVEKAHTPSPQVGSGLGLSIVKRIIEQHGQTITVRSAKGKGTQFTFSLQKAHLLKRPIEGGKKNG